MLRVWDDPAIAHGFLGRLGGKSRGPYSSMNLSQFVGDNPHDVTANMELLRSTMPPDLIFARVNQVHGKDVRIMTRTNAAERPRADGMVTSERGVALAIYTADCVPMLMTAPGIVGAFHAGWRGILAGIAREGVDAMVVVGARRSNIRAALGPSIGPCCFEVDADLGDRLVAEIPGAAAHRRPGRAGKAFLSLRGVVRDQLVACGLDNAAIANVGPCTRCFSDRYFSRRAAKGAVTGLQLSFVAMAER